MTYIDGFLVPVSRGKMGEYKKLARKAGKIWREYGALAYFECAGDDVPTGKLTSFTRAVKLEQGEVVIFSWIIYKSRAHRDAVNKKVMADPRLNMDMTKLPFDGKRMVWGGFKTIVEL